MIAAVHDDDPYAELLVSMHGAGIYNGRYGTNPELKLTYAEAEQREVKAFVREQEARHSRLIDATQIDDAERWTNYRLLQAFDRLSLYAAMVDLDAGAAHVVGPVPVTYAGETTELQIEPIEPWHVRISPYPFAHNAASFELICRTVPKRDWKDSDDFRDDFFAADAESERLTVSA